MRKLDDAIQSGDDLTPEEWIIRLHLSP
jgi:hypothetical protein